jgi:hypothetical protein
LVPSSGCVVVGKLSADTFLTSGPSFRRLRSSFDDIMDESPGIIRRFCNVLYHWWEEATEPIPWDRHISATRAVIRRVLLWTPVLVAIVVALSWIGFRIYTEKRAADLASKAMANIRHGNWQLARLQVASAANLRGDDPEVRRAKVFVESRMGNPASPEEWQALAEEVSLTPEESKERARSAMAHGTPEQFAAAVTALDAVGEHSSAAMARSSWHFSRGDLEQAIASARLAVRGEDDPDGMMNLAGLLAIRHGPAWSVGAMSPTDAAAASEAIALVEKMRGTRAEKEALAIGLLTLPISSETAREWATSALEDISAGNAALFPAASAAVSQGLENPQRLAWKISPFLVSAPPDRQAEFANWLCDHSLWEEALVVMSDKEAKHNASGFGARARALAGSEKWDELLALAEADSNVPQSVRLAWLHAAAVQSGRRGVASQSLTRAVRAAAQEFRLEEVAGMLDVFGSSPGLDLEIVQLCSDPAVADRAFRLAMERFGRKGASGLLQEAFAAAQKTTPTAASVTNYRRRTDLLAGRPVSLAETEGGIAVAPADPVPRFNHTLNLLLAGRPKEAEAVFDDMDVFVDRLPPGDQAIVISVLKANDDGERANRLSAKIDPTKLTEDERKLIEREP